MLLEGLLLLTAVPVSSAAPHPSVSIKTGESITLKLDPAIGEWKEISRGPAAIRPLVSAETDGVQRMKEHEESASNEKFLIHSFTPGEQRPQAQSDTVRFTMTVLKGTDDALLLIDNGYGRRLHYRAVMILPTGRTEPTDVCQVLSTGFGLEHWPYPLESLTLSDMELVPAAEDDPIICQ